MLFRRFAALSAIAVLVACAPGVRGAQGHPPKARQIRLTRTLCGERPITFTVLGDSLGRGWGASRPQKAFAFRIFRHLQLKRPGSIFRNLSEPGMTTQQVMNTQLTHLGARGCNIVLVVSGANEVQQLDRPRVVDKTFRALLARLKAWDPNALVVVAGIPDVSRAPRIVFFAKPVIEVLCAMDNAVILKAATDYGAVPVDYFALSRKVPPEQEKNLISSDGMHPSDQGYALMAKAGIKVLDRVLR